MNVKLITALAARREKAKSLPLQHIHVRAEPDMLRAILDSAYERSRRVDRLIAWLCAFGLVGFLAWRAVEMLGGW